MLRSHLLLSHRLPRLLHRLLGPRPRSHAANLGEEAEAAEARAAAAAERAAAAAEEAEAAQAAVEEAIERAKGSREPLRAAGGYRLHMNAANVTGYLGVSPYGLRYRVQYYGNNKLTRIGSYATPVSAKDGE